MTSFLTVFKKKTNRPNKNEGKKVNYTCESPKSRETLDGKNKNVDYARKREREREIKFPVSNQATQSICGHKKPANKANSTYKMPNSAICGAQFFFRWPNEMVDT